MDKADADWEALHGEATRLMKSGDPSSPEAMDLARRWMGKVFEATGGDPALTRKMRTVARETHEQPALRLRQARQMTSWTSLDKLTARPSRRYHAKTRRRSLIGAPVDPHEIPI